jgi:glutamate N-acetyltransferase/amino-acid N-acetyltransferase
VVNSGSANACTGEQGLKDAQQMVKLAEELSGVEPGRMAVASTGVIGQPLPMGLVEAGINEAAGSLSGIGGKEFAEAIRTTDKLHKEGAVEVALTGGKAHIGICAKGAGMIAPNMATLLAFVTTDVAAPSGLLHELLGNAVSGSFNRVSVDGDMSTNDCIFLLASGASGVTLSPGSTDAELFTAALASVCQSMALKMVADGEGATKTVEFSVTGAAAPEEAAAVARAIAGSPLVRTAFYGRDANWGRIMAAAGAALAGEPRLDADVFYEDICLARSGAVAPDAVDAQKLEKIMLQPEIAVTLDLHRGSESYTMYFSDLTHDYVTLNAEYTT